MADMAKLAAELEWLKENPDFDERPATLREFLGDGYLNIDAKVREAIKECLVDIIGENVRPDRITEFALAIITGGIGIGKTTVASIVLPYMAHWVLCLKDPQDFFNLLPGSRIAFMQMSTSEGQALEVVFGDIDARIKHSKWFEKYPRDPNFKRQIRFPKNIWIIPGDSAETTFEGYNILGGILDEADSHKVTDRKDYAEQGYNTISNRISSRFEDKGFLLVIGQMKSANGFAKKKYDEFRKRPDAYATRMAIWESLGDAHYADDKGEVHKFAYDTRRKQITPSGAAALVGTENIIWIPEVYRNEFENKPEQALRDLAGIPPLVGDPFISLVDRIDDCRDRWVERHGGMGSPFTPEGTFEPWFKALNTLRRACHVDIAYAEDGDALGLAVGHVPEVVEIEGELKPYIVFDALIRLTAPAGDEIFLSDMRHLVYFMKEDLGFRIVTATLDGFQSQDTIQQFRKRRMDSDYLSIDRQVLPYHDLREAIYERRVEFPPYMVKMHRGDTELVEIAVKELSELVDNGKKIDHPENGSKDVADAMAGVTYTLMGQRQFHRKVVHLRTTAGGDSSERQAVGAGMVSHPAFVGDGGLRAPLPPTTDWGRRR